MFKIILTTLKILDTKHIFLYIFTLVLKFLSKVFELLGIFTVLPVILLLLQNNNPKILITVSQYINIDFLINKELNFYLFLIVIIFFLKNFLALSFKWLVLKIEKFIVSRLYISLLQIFTSYDFLKFKSFTQGELLRNIITESKNFQQLSFNIFDLSFNFIFLSILVLFILLVSSSKIFFFYFFPLIVVALIFYKLLKNVMISISNKIAFLSAKINESVIDITNLYIEVLLKNSKIDFLKKYRLIFSNFKDQKNYKDFLNNIPKVLIELSVILFFAAFLFYKVPNADNNLQIFEEFFLIIATLSRVLPTLTEIQLNINKIYFSKRSLENISKELFILKKIKYKSLFKKNKIINKIKPLNTLEFKNINFEYNKSRVLKNLSFKIKKGTILGVFGPSGVGKSTFGLVVAGILKQSNGQIKINNKVVKRNQKVFENYGNIGYVSQNIYLINETIKKNITLKLKNNFDNKKYNESLNISEVNSFLKKRKIKDNLVLKNNGANLSVGQRQRIAIARAIFLAEQIIIFDEATSNLDVKTEEKIMRSLNKIKKDFIIIVITHRKKNIKYCDQKLYLK